MPRVSTRRQQRSRGWWSSRRVFLSLCVLGGMGLAVVQDAAYGVPRETQQEKTQNLQQQAKGGLFQKWTFDKDLLNTVPSGFARYSSDQPLADWFVQGNPTAPSLPNIVTGTSTCESCYQLLLVEGLEYEYPDLSIRLRASNGMAGTGGVILGAKDRRNFYAAVVDLHTAQAFVTRMADGQETVLARASVNLKPVDWHSLRVQRNTIISKDFIEVFVDGVLVLSVEDQALGLGQVGLVAWGKTSTFFDSFHAVPLFSHRPLSTPPAY